MATTLSIGMGNTDATGITTFIHLKEPTGSDRLEVDDLIKINGEQMKILNKDHFNNRYRVARIYDGDGTTGIAHVSGLIASKQPQKFRFTLSDAKVLDNNLKFSTKFNFDARTSVGIGTTEKEIEVASVGFTTRGVLRKSAPAGGIYLPGHRFQHNDKVSYSVGVGSTILYLSLIHISEPTRPY